MNESVVEDATISWFAQIGYTVGHGPNLAPGEPGAERSSFADAILKGRLEDAIHRLNPQIPAEAQEEALRKVLRLESSTFLGNNRAFHKMLRDGVEVEYRRPDGSIAGDHVRLLDFSDPASNDWFVVNQFTVIEAQHNRRPDVVAFVNGLPLAIIELKNAADSEATIWSAYSQLQTYKAEIPSLLKYNELLIVSDGLQARIGSLTANQEWFKAANRRWRWRRATGLPGAGNSGSGGVRQTPVSGSAAALHRVRRRHRQRSTTQDHCGYHQFHAVNGAVDETARASLGEQETAELPIGEYWAGRMHGGKPGDRRAGVDMWLTGFDAPCLHTMYADKPMRGHWLMQAIARVNRPDISILSDQFLAEVRGLKHKNVAAELLEKLLKDEIKVRSRRNLVQSQLFSDKLKKTLNAYHNRAIATHEVIEELIKLAKEMEAASKRGEDLGLNEDEIAFYDALATNESAIQAMGDEKLKVIAAELIKMVRKSVTIDWNLRDGARAKIRVIVKRILNKWGYPPDLQEEAVKTVLQQAELLCADWMEEDT